MINHYTSSGIVGEDIGIASSSGCSGRKSQGKVRVDGARRVWGTTTSTSLHSTLMKLSNVEMELVQIKQKTIVNSVGQVTRWWLSFVLLSLYYSLLIQIGREFDYTLDGSWRHASSLFIHPCC